MTNPQDEPEDPRDALLAEAAQIANRSPEERAEWIDHMRDMCSYHPNRDTIISGLEDYLDINRTLSGLKLQEAVFGEKLEAVAFTHLERLLTLPDEEWLNNPKRHLLGVAQLAVASHLFDPLRERCQQPDAQERLHFIFTNALLKQSNDLQSDASDSPEH